MRRVHVDAWKFKVEFKRGAIEQASRRGVIELPVVLLPEDEQMNILLFIDEEVGGVNSLNAQSELTEALLKQPLSTLNAASVTGQNVVRNEVTGVAA